MELKLCPAARERCPPVFPIPEIARGTSSSCCGGAEIPRSLSVLARDITLWQGDECSLIGNPPQAQAGKRAPFHEQQPRDGRRRSERGRVDDHGHRSFAVSGISAPIHDDDDVLELRSAISSMALVSGASHADPEVKSACPRKVSLDQEITRVLSEHNDLKLERVRVEVVGFHLPKHARDHLKRIESLAIDERVSATVGVERNPVGTLLCSLFPPWAPPAGLHSGRRSRSKGSADNGGGQSCPAGSGLGLCFGEGSAGRALFQARASFR